MLSCSVGGARDMSQRRCGHEGGNQNQDCPPKNRGPFEVGSVRLRNRSHIQLNEAGSWRERAGRGPAPGPLNRYASGRLRATSVEAARQARVVQPATRVNPHLPSQKGPSRLGGLPLSSWGHNRIKSSSPHCLGPRCLSSGGSQGACLRVARSLHAAHGSWAESTDGLVLDPL